MPNSGRIENILEVLLRYTIKDFEPKIDISDAGDELDAIAVGVNTMGEELDMTLKQIKEANVHLENKNQELEQFTYIASHDLQEPLLTIRNYIALFEEEYKDQFDDKALLYFKFLMEASNRMSFLVKGLLDYAMIGSHSDRTLIDSHAIISEVIQSIQPMIKQSGATIHVDDDLPTLMGYGKDFFMLFENLIGNAIKFHQDDIAPKIHISFEEDDDHMIFSVSDNGLGIPENQLSKIFIIFQRLHQRNKYGGSGIGLAHCKKIAELHNGFIKVSSKEGEGSTFSVLLKKV